MFVTSVLLVVLLMVLRWRRTHACGLRLCLRPARRFLARFSARVIKELG